MGTKNMAFAVTMLCVLAAALAPSATTGVKLRSLLAEEKGDGKPDESHMADSSPPPLSPPSGSSAATGQSKSSPPQTDQSPQKSNNSDSTGSKSPPLGNNSAKLVPPPAQESTGPEIRKQGDDKTPRGPPKKEDHQAFQAPKKGDGKPGQSPEKGDHMAPPSSDKGDGKASPAKEDNLPAESEGTSKSGKGDHSSKNEGCDTADASNLMCQKGVLVACILQSRNKSTEFFLLVQNTGEEDLKVNLSNPDDIKIGSEMLNLLKYSTKKINFTADTSRRHKIILNAGKGDCLLQTRTSISGWLPLQQFPAYAAQVKPMHGAFFLFATMVIIGGTWACCKFGKRERRVDEGIPYQQLEMSMQTQSTSVAANEIAANTWDESWDDDWDDEEAVVRNIGKNSTENVSLKGISSRSANANKDGSLKGISSRSANANKDGWDIDWDD